MRRFAIEAWGVRAAVEWDSPHLDARVRSLLLPIWRDDPTLQTEAVFRLTGPPGDERLEAPAPDFPTPPRVDIVESLERRLHLYLASQTREAAYVHAGVVAWQGRAVLFPARSWSGKSRLVQALVQSGASFLSDEYAIIDAQGLVHSFPRPLALRARYHNDRISAEDLGWRPQPAPLHVGAVVATRYEQEAEWAPLQLTQGEAMLELLNNTVSARDAPQVVMRCLSKAGIGAVNLRGPRGEAAPSAERILRALTLAFEQKAPEARDARAEQPE